MAIICGSRSVILMCVMISLLVCKDFEGTDARELGYGVFPRNGNGIARCNPMHPEQCMGKPGNSHYSRGCENGERCRNGHKGKRDKDVKGDKVADDKCKGGKKGHGKGDKTQNFNIGNFQNAFPFDPKVPGRN